jgi:hypothetical protein
MNRRPYPAPERSVVLAVPHESFPWFASAMLAMEAAEVISLRLEKFVRCEADADREAILMVSEKVAAAFEATASLLLGATPGAVVGRYREHVAANARRLSA